MAEPLELLPALRLSAGKREQSTEAVATEEPLELRLLTPEGPVTLAVLMRTPGQDRALLLGWLVSEGALPLSYDLQPDPASPNVWLLQTPEVSRLRESARLGFSSSACGVCGSGSIERLTVQAMRPEWTAPPLPADLICSLPERLQQQQGGFQATGGLHGAALFSASGQLLTTAEDVGRHNAVDKVVGASLADLPLTDRMLCVSSRAGFEIVQKAVMAGIAVVVSVGAPTSLAVETATVFGVTLCAFTREGRTTVYSASERLMGQQ